MSAVLLSHSPSRIGKHQQHRAIVLPDIQLIFIHGLSVHNKGSGFSRLHVDPLFSLESKRKRDGTAKPNQQIDKTGQQWQVVRDHSQIQNITLLGVDVWQVLEKVIMQETKLEKPMRYLTFFTVLRATPNRKKNSLILQEQGKKQKVYH